MTKGLFIKEFFKNWREVGSVIPSSSFLVGKMLESIDWDGDKIFVEFGPGSGCITRELLNKMNTTSRLILFETNLGFYHELEKIKDSRLTIYNESALNLEERLGGKTVHYILSGIPLATLAQDDKKSLLQSSYESLVSNGHYIQFQYSLESQADLKSIFDGVSLGFTFLNIPPAFVYSCLKK